MSISLELAELASIDRIYLKHSTIDLGQGMTQVNKEEHEWQERLGRSYRTSVKFRKGAMWRIQSTSSYCEISRCAPSFPEQCCVTSYCWWSGTSGKDIAMLHKEGPMPRWEFAAIYAASVMEEVRITGVFQTSVHWAATPGGLERVYLSTGETPREVGDSWGIGASRPCGAHQKRSSWTLKSCLNGAQEWD